MLRAALRRTPRPLVSTLRPFFHGNYRPPQKTRSEVGERASYSELADRCRHLLRTSLTDFYLPRSVDFEHGGFHEVLRDEEFVAERPKHTIFQARQVWYFSTLAERGNCERNTIDVAARGFEFITTHAEDKEFGGVYFIVSRRGEVEDSCKCVYAHAFAIYAAAALYRVTKRPEVLDAAQRLFYTLDDKAYDQEYGGYFEWFKRDWSEHIFPRWGGDIPADFAKTFNTHLHLLEAFTELYRVWPDSHLSKRLTELLTINASAVQFGSAGTRIDFFRRDWSPIEDYARVSYGHEFEIVWMALDAVEQLDLPPTAHLSWAQKTIDSSIRFGSDRHYGGFGYSGYPGKRADDLRKIWWVQAEAMISLLRMFQLTGHAPYYSEFLRTFRFVDEQIIAPGGGWWAETRDDGSRKRIVARTGPWGAAYHAGRCLMWCAKMLDELSELRGRRTVGERSRRNAG